MTHETSASSSSQVSCAEALVRLLRDRYAVDTVFGIPGVHTVPLYRGLEAGGLRHVTPRHEQGAGFMADGYARASSKPGVCFIITGPGMTNIATAMGQALADSVPMLVISSVNRRDTLGRGQGRLHELPSQQNVLAGVSRFSHTLLDPSALPEVLARSFAMFQSARPGPVHIEIPIDLFEAPIDLPGTASPTRLYRAGAHPEGIALAAEWLRQAQAPLVLLGGGCAEASKAARTLVEHLDAPTVTTINAKGVLGRGHPLDLGAPGTPVVALVGDGGAMFTLSELATAVDEGLPVVVVLWNNSGYEEIRRYMDAHGVARVGVDPTPPDFQCLADGFGLASHRVESPIALDLALSNVSRISPTLIEIDAERWQAALD
ncbi:hypothetical protein HLV40_12390 [Chromohalobacter salexigens]|nr:hypothetical protein [Chromohalobacter salexigens]